MLRNVTLSRWQPWQRLGASLALVLSTVAVGLTAVVGFSPVSVQAKSANEPTSNAITVSQLPPQGRDMMALIYQGGPFRYDKDGTVFGNRERILPSYNRGYYREYTVRTPGERSRGARRIICGGMKPAAPEACYYTDDHYASFRQITR